ncbi:hypothetical protein V2A01_33730, partial [Pseudomonas aeruginosa]
RPAVAVPLVVDYAGVWNSIRKAGGDRLLAYNLRLPRAGGQPATVFYRLTDAPHVGAFNTLTLDPANGLLKSDQRYSDRP